MKRGVEDSVNAWLDCSDSLCDSFLCVDSQFRPDDSGSLGLIFNLLPTNVASIVSKFNKDSARHQFCRQNATCAHHEGQGGR